MQTFDQDQIKLVLERLKVATDSVLNQLLEDENEIKDLGKKYVHKDNFYRKRRHIYRIRNQVKVLYKFVDSVLKGIYEHTSSNVLKGNLMLDKLQEAEEKMWSRIKNIRRE